MCPAAYRARANRVLSSVEPPPVFLSATGTMSERKRKSYLPSTPEGQPVSWAMPWRITLGPPLAFPFLWRAGGAFALAFALYLAGRRAGKLRSSRSEERRVGKEC